MSDDLTILLKRFKPTNKRNTASVMRVQTGTAIEEMTVFETAWMPFVAVGWTSTHPLEVIDNSSLSPVVWMTKDHQLLVRKISYGPRAHYDLLMVIEPEKLHPRDRDRLVLSLTGRYDEINAEFDTLRKQSLANTIDRCVVKLRGKYKPKPGPASALLESLVDPTLDPKAYVLARDKVVNTLIV